MIIPQGSFRLPVLQKWRLGFELIVLYSLFAHVLAIILYPGGPIGPLGMTANPDSVQLRLAVLISAASLATSLVAIIGFILTTILAWRKERREQKSFELDNAKKELEIAKLRAELEKKEDRKIIVE